MRTRWKVLLGVLVWPLGLYWLLRSPSIGRTAKIAIASVAGLFVILIIVAIATSGGGGSTTTAAEETTTKESSTTTAAEETTTEESVPQTPEEPKGVGDGTHRVPNDIAPGTYRSTDETTCYWARLRGFGGEVNDIIANGNNSPEIVTIRNNDAGFETQGCGDWVPVKQTAPASPAAKFGDGTYDVGVHITPGTYRADGQGTCYWARLSNFSHDGVSGIIANGNNPTVITIAPSDAGFTTFGCGTWTQ